MQDFEETLDGPTGEVYVRFVQACTRGCQDMEAFRALVREYVRVLLPHQFSIAVLGCVSFDQLSIWSATSLR